MMKDIKNLLLFNLVVIFLIGCKSLPSFDDVLPDKRTTYKKSKDLPELEIPPDLTVTKGQYSSEIPSDAESTSLNEFERQRSMKNSNEMILGSGNFEDEKWIALAGSSGDIWPKLKDFWSSNGYNFYLDDAELGVLETDWKETDKIKQKFKVLTEPAEDGGTILFLSSERQELSEGEWLDTQSDESSEKDIINKLSLHFDVTLKRKAKEFDSKSISTNDLVDKVDRKKVQIRSTKEGIKYLEIAAGIDLVWSNSREVIEQAGYFYEAGNETEGTHSFLYMKEVSEDEEKSLFSRLKFWGDDENEKLLYQLSLKSVGDKTEIFLLKEDGEVEVEENAANIFNTLQSLYSNSKI